MPAVAVAASRPAYLSVGRYPVAVEVSPNGAFAYATSAEDRTVTVIDTASRTISGVINAGARAGRIAFTPDSRTAYVTDHGDLNTDKGLVLAIDTATRAVTARISVLPLISPNAVAVTPDGKKAYVAGANYLSVIDTATNVSRAVYIGYVTLSDVEVTPDGSRVYLTDQRSSSVVVLSTATDSVIATVPLPTIPSRIAIMPDGRRVYATSSLDNKVYMIATAGNYVGATIDVAGSPAGLAAAPNGRQVLVTSNFGHTLLAIDVATNTIATTKRVGEYPSRVAFTPDGTEFYLIHDAGQYIAIHDTTGEPAPGSDRVVRGESLAIGQYRTSRDGRFRLIMQSDGNLVLYAATGEALWHTHTNGSGATYAVLQHDGNFVLYTPAGVAKWHTQTWNTTCDRLVVQNDSNVVLYQSDALPQWHRWK
jgi:YVTN family beta-propeller protein